MKKALAVIKRQVHHPIFEITFYDVKELDLIT